MNKQEFDVHPDGACTLPRPRNIISTPESPGRIFRDRSLIALCLMYFTQAYGFYFNITWLPTYLARRRGLTVDKIGVWAGVLAGLPLILSSLADVTGGWTTDALSRRLGLRIGRCGVGIGSLVVAGLARLIVGANLRLSDRLGGS